MSDYLVFSVATGRLVSDRAFSRQTENCKHKKASFINLLNKINFFSICVTNFLPKKLRSCLTAAGKTQS